MSSTYIDFFGLDDYDKVENILFKIELYNNLKVAYEMKCSPQQVYFLD